ncbi:hypothetical protein GGI21_006315, partial [Coemansia aciculifera]
MTHPSGGNSDASWMVDTPGNSFPQHASNPVHSPTPNVIKINFEVSSRQNEMTQGPGDSHHSSIIVRTTTIEEPFRLASPVVIASTPVSANDFERVAEDFGAHSQIPQQPQQLSPYLFDVVGDEVSVVLLSGSSVVSKWREPPAIAAYTPTIERQVLPTPRNRIAAEPFSTPLTRQQSEHTTAKASETLVLAKATRPTSHAFPAAPWDSLTVANPAPRPVGPTTNAQSSFMTDESEMTTRGTANSNGARSSNGAKDAAGSAKLSDGIIVLIS